VAASAVAGYGEAIRNTPLLIQSYFLILGTASVGILPSDV